MDNDKLREIKDENLRDLRVYLPIVRERIEEFDPRIWSYCSDCIREDIDTSNVYELLGIRKVIRLMNSYETSPKKVRQVLNAIEGRWEDGKHICGGLKFDTPRGHQHVRLMPYQVWCVFGIYAFLEDVTMKRLYQQGEELLPSEFIRNGEVFDKRRLCTEAHIMQTRKSGKTEFGGALDFVEANIIGPSNAQVLICANSKDQAKIAFKAIKEFSYQLDPKATSKAGGNYLRVTADETTWRPGQGRTAEIKVMSAGGKKKDGLFASWVHADEHGSANYVKDHSDMQDLVEVCAGSMGPRRERMLLHTTTAGLVNEGPYQLQIRGVEEMLLEEMNTKLGEARKTPEDSWFAFILRLDPWDFNGNVQELDHDNLFRKVNRSIGTTVQPTWYNQRIHDALTKGEDTRREVLTKDFNMWQTDKVSEWIKPDEIRALQIDRTIEQCTADEGWIVLTGMDFTNTGDDLQASSYLATRLNPETGKREFFADMDAWMSSEAMEKSPLKSLLRQYADSGYLHILPGSVLSPQLPVDRIVDLRHTYGVNMMGWGYDSARATEPINLLKDWLVSVIGVPPASLSSYIMPVRQNLYSYNPLVDEITYCIKCEKPNIRFSSNPLWAWEFGGCHLMVSTDGMENKKPVKKNKDSKVDNIQALLNALSVFDTMNGKVIK